ncbi:MAG: helix-turn-helix domain-containing protein [Methanospirillum sp.]|nr:helix-turn-helix domain-containing protein [Methanospirillum sp.]
MVRKDLTVSLEEEQIEELLEIAESQQITLSALLRDIVSSYFRSGGREVHYRSGELHPNSVAVFGGSPSALAETVVRHDAAIADLQRRVAALEPLHKKTGYQAVIQPAVPDLMALTSPVPGMAEVIDCDLPQSNGLSDEALVKVPKQPVLPVMDAMEMGSMKISPDKEYTQTEAAVALGVSVSTMRKHIKDGKIPARKVGRSWLIHGSDIISRQSGV